MRFRLGFVAGLVVGYWLGATPAEERRAKLDQAWSGVRDNPRVQRVSGTVSRDARRLGDAVEQRVVATADTAVEAVAGTVEPEGSGEGSSGSSGTSPGSGSSAPSDAARRSA
ncbi:MAG TPA: hypothetical protein VFW63_11155 [Acidimicrobiales bacterium]|nr:hypothetical protein [Acidimicrobiales bacterium]